LLRRALARVMARHDVLRTSFEWKGDKQPLQLVHAEVDPVIEFEDVSGLPDVEQTRTIEDWIDREKRRPFGWRGPPLFRIQIHQRGADIFQFTLSFHHAILDGWSVAAFMTDLFGSYLGEPVPDPKTAIPRFRDFVALEREVLKSSEAETFWADLLRGAALT